MTITETSVSGKQVFFHRLEVNKIKLRCRYSEYQICALLSIITGPLSADSLTWTQQ